MYGSVKYYRREIILLLTETLSIINWCKIEEITYKTYPNEIDTRNNDVRPFSFSFRYVSHAAIFAVIAKLLLT